MLLVRELVSVSNVRCYRTCVVYVSAVVVHPRKSHVSVAEAQRTRRQSCPLCGVAHNQLVQIDVIECLVKVLFTAPFQELRLHLHVRNLRDGDCTGLEEGAITYVAVKHYLRACHIRPVYMPEDVSVLLASLQREGDGHCVAV